jgi:hypothetical protein
MQGILHKEQALQGIFLNIFQGYSLLLGLVVTRIASLRLVPCKS